MDNHIKMYMKDNDNVFRNTLERIFEKYSRVDGSGVEVCLQSMTCRTEEGIRPWNGEEVERQMRSLKTIADSTGISARGQDTSGDIQLDETQTCCDDPSVSESQMERTSETASWESGPDGSAVQPEQQDEELERTLSSRGSLLDLYPSMLCKVGGAWRRQAVTEAANAVLRRYRRRGRPRPQIQALKLRPQRQGLQAGGAGQGAGPVVTDSGSLSRTFTVSRASPRSSPQNTLQPHHQPSRPAYQERSFPSRLTSLPHRPPPLYSSPSPMPHRPPPPYSSPSSMPHKTHPPYSSPSLMPHKPHPPYSSPSPLPQRPPLPVASPSQWERGPSQAPPPCSEQCLRRRSFSGFPAFRAFPASRSQVDEQFEELYQRYVCQPKPGWSLPSLSSPLPRALAALALSPLSPRVRKRGRAPEPNTPKPKRFREGSPSPSPQSWPHYHRTTAPMSPCRPAGAAHKTTAPMSPVSPGHSHSNQLGGAFRKDPCSHSPQRHTGAAWSSRAQSEGKFPVRSSISWPRGFSPSSSRRRLLYGLPVTKGATAW
ncbi:hypothetical protein COCON_G00071560 [Conger conger]|uniref:Uncharacterized protein n=1 Tax=Conger conger TaxID=82655 RepID=A0A9Q1DTE9_CONCO|nr:WAS/WASL-interacting protein family member 3 [Conger conger]KAJ8280090.1 hypothetical protein COCON_G00071560 [Conger conger]